MTFKELDLIDPILRALEAEGYTHPTPIQEQSIPILLKKRDLLGCAQTGTGKTAAFSIPIIQHLHAEVDPKQKRQIQSLIVTPTRELALQIDESIKTYAKFTQLKSTVIFGQTICSNQSTTVRSRHFSGHSRSFTRLDQSRIYQFKTHQILCIG